MQEQGASSLRTRPRGGRRLGAWGAVYEGSVVGMASPYDPYSVSWVCSRSRGGARVAMHPPTHTHTRNDGNVSDAMRRRGSRRRVAAGKVSSGGPRGKHMRWKWCTSVAGDARVLVSRQISCQAHYRWRAKRCALSGHRRFWSYLHYSHFYILGTRAARARPSKLGRKARRGAAPVLHARSRSQASRSMLPAARRMAAAKDGVLNCVVALLGGLAPEGCAWRSVRGGRVVAKR